MFTQEITQIAQKYAKNADAEDLKIAIKNVENALNLMSEGFFPLNLSILRDASGEIYDKFKLMFAPTDNLD
jgi:hypothetical protein